MCKLSFLYVWDIHVQLFSKLVIRSAFTLAFTLLNCFSNNLKIIVNEFAYMLSVIGCIDAALFLWEYILYTRHFL